jgi:hypothetical protein
MVLAWLSLLNPVACAQPVIRDSSVGYIDSAILGHVLRLRYDAAFDNNQPARAEFFYARSGPAGPGLPRPDTSVDYQDVWAYAEVLWSEYVSGFVDAPLRFLDPEINPNAHGIGDLNAGLKCALIHCPDFVATTQLRVYVPTGDADEGLGTHHASLEPAFLVYRQLSDRLRFEGELRYWIPIDGTEFAGDIIRYGAGLGYWLSPSDAWQVTPVVEVVGWTVLDGMTSVSRGPGLFVIEAADGDTIVNVKAGLRTRVGPAADLYIGYGQPLTGDQWYENTLRVELRWSY